MVLVIWQMVFIIIRKVLVHDHTSSANWTDSVHFQPRSQAFFMKVVKAMQLHNHHVLSPLHQADGAPVHLVHLLLIHKLHWNMIN